MRAVSNDTRYGFAIGRLRSLETRLLDRAQWDRLVRARDQAEFRTLLADTDHLRSARSEGGTDELGLAELFNAALDENFRFFARYCREERVLDVFRLRADVHNLKLAVKASLAGIEEILPGRLDFGRWSEERIAALAEARDRTEPGRFREAVAAVRSRWEQEPDPAFLDATLDRAAQAEIIEAVRDNDFLAGYFRRYADVQNLRALVRIKLLDEKRTELESVLLSGGIVRLEKLPRLLDEDWETIAAAFRLTDYDRLMEQGVGEVVKSRSLLRFERLGRELELAWLARARYLTFGYEPLVSYYLFRENEILTLRRLAVAKSAGLSEAECAELVAYV